MDSQYLSELTERASGAVKSKISRSYNDCFSTVHYYSLWCFVSLAHNSYRAKHDYCNDFDLRKPLERQFFNGAHVDCVSVKDLTNLTLLQDQCATFLAQFSRCFDS
ncbi:hypothetical protein QN277_011783 [Acacia crassicarpa]|uniref:Uncharacterized protein n=1 Tax=Acacia crassicarpa TaxID=499986 RepID=A0AAE1TDU0_9FABA|nr:hypothetical protein QN277_011783 [Acacia crassicarpa]